MSRPVRSAALQAADFLAAVRYEMMNDSDESEDYSEDNDNMNQNNTEREEDIPENEVEIPTQNPDDTSGDEIAVPVADSTQQTDNEFLSTDGSQRWSKVPINPNTGRIRLQNVLNQSLGPISAVVQRSDSVLGTFSCFITTEMLTEIAHYTNEEGQTQILKHSDRNITADNFFSSYSLVSQLLSWKLTSVGTVRKNKKFLPLEFQSHFSRPMGSSVFRFQENISIVCYTPKARKSVTLNSSTHYEPILVESEPFKPKIFQF